MHTRNSETELFAAGVVCVEPETTVRDACRLMRVHRVDELVVTAKETRMPLGIISARDIAVGVVAADLDPHVLTAGDVAEIHRATHSGE